MLARVLPVGLNHFRFMIGVIDLYAVQGYLGAYLVEQVNIVIGKTRFAATGMRDERDRSAAVRGIDGQRQIRMNRDEPGLANELATCLPAARVAVFAQ